MQLIDDGISLTALLAEGYEDATFIYSVINVHQRESLMIGPNLIEKESLSSIYCIL